MGQYRLYFMDRFSGHIEHRHDFEAEDEDLALKRASAWRNGQPMELWRGERKIKRWEAAPPR